MPPPWPRHRPLDCELFGQLGCLHRAPPPWALHRPRDCAVFSQSSYEHGVPPPWAIHLRLACALLLQPGCEHRLPPPWVRQRPLDRAMLLQSEYRHTRPLRPAASIELLAGMLELSRIIKSAESRSSSSSELVRLSDATPSTECWRTSRSCRKDRPGSDWEYGAFSVWCGDGSELERLGSGVLLLAGASSGDGMVEEEEEVAVGGRAAMPSRRLRGELARNAFSDGSRGLLSMEVAMSPADAVLNGFTGGLAEVDDLAGAESAMPAKGETGGTDGGVDSGWNADEVDESV